MGVRSSKELSPFKNGNTLLCLRREWSNDMIQMHLKSDFLGKALNTEHEVRLRLDEACQTSSEPETLIPFHNDHNDESNNDYFYSANYILFSHLYLLLRWFLKKFWKGYPGYPCWKKPQVEGFPSLKQLWGQKHERGHDTLIKCKGHEGPGSLMLLWLFSPLYKHMGRL